MPRGQYARKETVATDSLSPLAPLELGATDGIEIAERIRTDEADLDAFMQEPVEIEVATSSDTNAEPMVPVGVNGRMVYIPRGQPVVVKRMYVERLARAKQTQISQNLDPRLGEGINALQRNHALLYPFAVLKDSDKGRAWVKAILAEKA